jgi:hypothetical protein
MSWIIAPHSAVTHYICFRKFSFVLLRATSSFATSLLTLRKIRYSIFKTVITAPQTYILCCFKMLHSAVHLLKVKYNKNKNFSTKKNKKYFVNFCNKMV